MGVTLVENNNKNNYDDDSDNNFEKADKLSSIVNAELSITFNAVNIYAFKSLKFFFVFYLKG